MLWRGASRCFFCTFVAGLSVTAGGVLSLWVPFGLVYGRAVALRYTICSYYTHLSMINRSIVRIRVFQQLYESLSSDRLDVALADKSLTTSLRHTYYLYYYLLDLIRALAAYQRELLEIRDRRFLKSATEQTPRRLSDMSLVKEIARCTEIQNPLDEMQVRWETSDQLLRYLYGLLEQDPAYEALPEDVSTLSMQEQCDYWANMLKLLFRTAELNEHLSEASFYWSDATAVAERLEVEEMPSVEQVDATVAQLKGSDAYRVLPLTGQPVVTIQDFALKTLRRGAKSGLELPQNLLPMFHSDRDRLYAHQLLSETLLHREEYDELLTPRLDNWEKERVAMVDMILMEMAVAEALHCPDIALVVTINEYIELAKVYDTPKSASFINAVLDKLFSDLKSEGKLLK